MEKTGFTSGEWCGYGMVVGEFFWMTGSAYGAVRVLELVLYVCMYVCVYMYMYV